MHWIAFGFDHLGGLALSLFIGSVLPLILDKIARDRAPRIVVTAAFVYIIQVVYAVWTSAYNFVPFGGTLTRETSHVLVFFNFLGIYFGVYTASKILGCELLLEPAENSFFRTELGNVYTWLRRIDQFAKPTNLDT